jgi:hypothetical protein
MFHDIGETAGEIWEFLKGGEPVSLSALVRKTKRPQSMVCMSIGWLAREDKLVFTQTKRGVSLSLKK